MQSRFRAKRSRMAVLLHRSLGGEGGPPAFAFGSIRATGHSDQLATSPAFLRVAAISARAARAIRPLSFASVTKRNPIAIIRAA
jgi:hypothetical protein